MKKAIGKKHYYWQKKTELCPLIVEAKTIKT